MADDASFQASTDFQAAFDADSDVLTGAAQGRLKSFLERLERLDADKAAVAEDMKQVFAEAKGEDFDTKIIRQIIKIRRMDKDDLDEQETLLDIYKRALGMLPDNMPESAAAE